ncbi:MAG: alanine racemase [Verrucomicrobiota bacterium]|nr:alanine racemase [Verrucomicrobiota bacterium]
MSDNSQYRCWAEVDLAAIRSNARVAQQHLGDGSSLLAVIKANGYGHGLGVVAAALKKEAQLFGVANVEEAIEACAAVSHPVMILGPALPSERREIIERGFIASISSFAEAQEFSALASETPAAVVCVIDTGMGRMGIAERHAVEELRRIAALPRIHIHSVSSHLPVADDDVDYTRDQLARFRTVITAVRAAVPGDYLVHTLPTAGVFRFADSALDLARAGLMLYGATSVSEFQPLLTPAMTLKTRVALLRDVPAGSSISYGRTFTTRRKSRIATLSAGYADGLPRAVSGRGAVLIGGRRCPILGRVTMDLTMVDVTDVPKVALGDEAVLIGTQGEEQILVTEVAQWASTIAWEIFTGIGSRVARVYV